jgi:protein-S-isoprenylcysteine O-methyltransferase Ste14
MFLDPLRAYLLAGLLFHKAVWEVMKTRKAKRGSERLGLRLVKAVKMGILAGIIVQCFLPNVLPISADSAGIRSAGALVFTIGLATAVVGRLQLGKNWSDIEGAKVLPEQRVVAAGLYRFVRHPIYAGDLCLLAGLELALNSWLVFGALALIPIVYRQAAREEGMLVTQLAGYDEYCRRTKRFIPFVV